VAFTFRRWTSIFSPIWNFEIQKWKMGRRKMRRKKWVKEKLIFKLELKENAKNWKVFYRQSVMEGNANDNCTRVRRVVSSFNIFN
jgi:hypothetical protein